MSIFTELEPDSSRLEPVLPPAFDGGWVWHYTDAAGVLGLLTDNAIRASSISSMNDSGEFQHGIELIAEQWRTHRHEYEHADEMDQILIQARARLRPADAFVVCGTTLGKSLSQWRAYGSYAVGINPAAKLQVRRGSKHGPPLVQWSSSTEQARVATRTGWRKVLYDPTEKAEYVTRLLVELNRLAPDYRGDGSAKSQATFRLLMDLYFCAVAYLKHEAFADESEVRLFVHYYAEAEGVYLRPGRLGIVAFVLVETAQKLVEEDPGEQPAQARYSQLRFPLAAANLGPGGPNAAAAFEGLKLALVRSGYEFTPQLAEVPLQ
jgi:hypothetical protein